MQSKDNPKKIKTQQYMSTFVRKRGKNSQFNSEKGWEYSISTLYGESSFILSQKESKNY